MTQLENTFFGDPIIAYIILGTIEVVLVASWFYYRTKLLTILLGVPILLAGVVLTLDYAFLTDRETIMQISEEIADGLEKNSLSKVDTYIDKDYAGFGQSKNRLLGIAANQARAMRIEEIRFSNVKLDIQGKNAEMKITTTIHLTDRAGGGVVPLGWQIQWIKRPEGWRIVSISEPTQVMPGFSRAPAGKPARVA